MQFLSDVTLNYFIMQVAVWPTMCSVTCPIPCAHMPSFLLFYKGISFHDSRRKTLSNGKCLVPLRSYFLVSLELLENRPASQKFDLSQGEQLKLRID